MEYDSTRHRLAPGTRIGDHLIVRGVLGEGGTAVVYEALHTRLGASVALKVVDVSEEYMEGARARLLREAQVCASLEDSHVPRVYDVGELEDHTPYVVMERVSGRTLENVLAQGALPLDVAYNIAEDLLYAVEAVEKAGIVHRDIKPPNIILQTNAEGTLRVRLMDFGVSKTVEDPTASDPGLKNNPKLTQQGAIVGTPHYMAPEQIVGPSVDSRADLYAVGVVVYEMIAGRTPFEGQTTGEVVAAVLHTRPLPLRKWRDVHEELEAWVEKAMAPRRTDRFQSARQMREALREAWSEHQEFVQAAGRRRWAKRARVVGALGLVGVGMALPLPAGYNLETLTQLLSGKRTTSSPAVVQTATIPAAAAASTAVAAPGGETEKEIAAGLSPPAWDLSQGPDLPPTAAAAVPQALPQSEPPRGGGVAEAANVGIKPFPPNGPGAAAAATARPGMFKGRPVGPAQRVGVGQAPLARQTAPAPVVREPTPNSRGVLLNDYLRQLDRELELSTLRDMAPAAAAPIEDKRPGQPAPNPFDGLPDNPYQQQ